MGLFGFGGVRQQAESRAIEAEMNKIGAYEGTHLEKCERCDYYVRPSQTGSNYYGGCQLHGIKVFSNRVCNHFKR